MEYVLKIELFCRLKLNGGRRRAHNLKVVGSMPDPIEVSTLRQDDYTKCASLHPGV